MIREAFDARVMRVGKNCEPVDLGPDHFVRLAAVGSLIKLLTAGRPLPKAVEPRRDRGQMTLAELEAQLAGSGEARPSERF